MHGQDSCPCCRLARILLADTCLLSTLSHATGSSGAMGGCGALDGVPQRRRAHGKAHESLCSLYVVVSAAKQSRDPLDGAL